MRFILSPDKFKGSLTGLEFCEAVETGLKKVLPNSEICRLPLADGGDGTIEVANYYLKGDLVSITVNNPFFKPIKASYLFASSSKTAFIEMAEASGLKVLSSEDCDCKNATTHGTGELIADAIAKGAEQIILGIGGSATNDCGIGMATALGYKFIDINSVDVIPVGKNLSKIVSIDTTNVHPKLHKVSFKIASDVTNPLYGHNGAAYVYAAQKGASNKDIELLDQGLQDFSKVLKRTFNVDPQSIKGAGAAGGMGVASKVFLNGNLKPGITLIKDLANYDNLIKNADWIITGEGKLDSQTISGKTVRGVLESAAPLNIQVSVLCGSISLTNEHLKTMDISYADAIMNRTSDINSAMQNSIEWVKKMAEDFAKTLIS